MKEQEFCIALIKYITGVLLEHTKSQSETLKIITVGVQSALNIYTEKK